LTDTHVQFFLKTKFSPFAAAMTADRRGGHLAGVGQRGAEQAEVITQPVGTGPYVFKEAVASDHVTMTANKSYWARSPTTTRRSTRSCPRPQPRGAVKSGRTTIIALPPANDIRRCRATQPEGLPRPSDRTIQIVINTAGLDAAAAEQAEVRQALNYAIDRTPSSRP